MTALISLANLLKVVVHSTLWTTPKYSPHTISFFSFGFGCLINFILKINQNIYIYINMEVLGYGYCNESYSSTALISFNPLLPPVVFHWQLQWHSHHFLLQKLDIEGKHYTISILVPLKVDSKSTSLPNSQLNWYTWFSVHSSRTGPSRTWW